MSVDPLDGRHCFPPLAFSEGQEGEEEGDPNPVPARG